MNIQGFGEGLVEKVVDAGLVKSRADIYRLTRTDLKGLERMGEKGIDKVMAAIESSRAVSMAKLIHALGIRGIGVGTSKDLAEYYLTFEDFLGGIKDGDPVGLIGKIGGVAVKRLQDYFSNPGHLHEVRDLLEQVSIVESPYPLIVGDITDRLYGKSVVFTGTLSRPRSVLSAELMARGASVSTSLTRNTDFLIAGENPGSKLALAQELGVTVLKESEL